jgi:hypothetical protein
MKLTDFDRDVLTVSVKAFREQDRTLSEQDAEPVFLEDWPRVLREVAGKDIGNLQLRWLRLRGRFPTDRGRVCGQLFWLRRDVVRWAETLNTTH